MLQRKRIIIFISLTLIFGVESFFVCGTARVRAGGGLLLSEIRLAGPGGADDEFVEIYNPGSEWVDLRGWSLKRRSATGVTEANLLSDLGSQVDPFSGERSAGESLGIAPGGYFLLAPRPVCGQTGEESCYRDSARPDNYYSVRSGLLAKDNTLVLLDEKKTEIDKVGWGKAADYRGEAFAENPASGQSLRRKAAGAGWQDTGDNGADFLLEFSPTPQNSESGPASAPGEEEAAELPRVPAPVAEPDKAPAQIVINELLLNPVGADSELEFVELFNAGEAVELTGWTLADRAGEPGAYVFPAGFSLGAGEYCALFSSQTKISFNNSGDGAYLQDPQGETVSQAPVSGAAAEGVAFALDTEGAWAWTSVPTPGEKNVLRAAEDVPAKNKEAEVIKEAKVQAEVALEAPVAAENFDYSDRLFLSEILPDPAGRDNREGNFEGVELGNEGEMAVNLRGWCLDDVLEKGSRPYCFLADRWVPAGGYLWLSSEETKLTLNNSGEEVNLLWPDGQVVDRCSFSKSREGFAYALSSGGQWFWSAQTSSGKPNPAPAAESASPELPRVAAANSGDFSETETEEGNVPVSGERSDPALYAPVSVAEARALPLDSLVAVEGLVATPPGILGKDLLYLSDREKGAGLQVFSPAGALPAFSAGEEVRLFGALAQVGGERRLIFHPAIAAEKLGEDNLLSVNAIPLIEAGEGYLGALVRVEGEIAATDKAQMLVLAAGAAQLKVYAKPATGISFAGYRAGERVAVTGQLSRTSAGYRLLPRYASDLVFLEEKNNGIMKKESGAGWVLAENPAFRLQFFCLGSLLLLADWGRLRLRQKRRRAGAKDANQ